MPSYEYRAYKNWRDIGLAFFTVLCVGGGLLALASYGNYENISAVKTAVLDNPTTDHCSTPPSGSTTTNCKGGGEGWITSSLIAAICIIAVPFLFMLVAFLWLKSKTEEARLMCEMDRDYAARSNARSVATGYYVMGVGNVLAAAYAIMTAIWATIGYTNTVKTDDDYYFFLLQTFGFYIGGIAGLFAAGLMGWLGTKAMYMCTDDKMGVGDVFGSGQMYDSRPHRPRGRRRR